jgi:hypothetical protein
MDLKLGYAQVEGDLANGGTPRRPGFQRLATVALMTVLTSIAATLFAASPASADYGDILRNQNTNGCLGTYVYWNETYLHADPSECGTVWNIHQWRDGTHEVRLGGACLDDSHLGLRYIACNKTRWQSWYFDWHSDGSKTLRNQETRACLDHHINAQGYSILRAFPCNWHTWQRWY